MYCVVNCFQMSTFARGKTTKYPRFIQVPCCELLSNEYLCKRKNNFALILLMLQYVVNCFQMSTFARGKTTDYGLYTMSQVFAKIFRKENKVVFHEKSQS